MRSQRLRCPKCRSTLDSLAWHFPDLATEWSSYNPLSAWHVRLNATLPFIPEWICLSESSHGWNVTSTVRVRGSTYPFCRESEKPMTELCYFDALRSAFGEAFSGLALRSEAFTRRSVQVPGVTVPLGDGRPLLVEYDGSFWHAENTDVDFDKSHDLLATRALVTRLRERPLPALSLDSPDYLELAVSLTVPDPESTVRAILVWLESSRAPGETRGPDIGT